jgi:uncharacterized protein
VGRLLLTDIVEQLARPGRDPREDLPKPFFKKGVLKLEDLEVGMELMGSVLNVVDFGAFVDIGLHDSGLVHISQLSSRYVRDPHDVVTVGQIVQVWVLEIDKARRRVALTMIEPGTVRQQPARRDGRPEKHDKRPAEQVAKPRPPKPPRQREQRQAPREPQTRTYVAKPAKKPAKPLTEAMREGKEPLRTFGDLKQFFDKRESGDGANTDG